MTPSLRLDHIIIAVKDLNTAVTDFRALGFNPFFGGRHATGATHNALIVLSSGDYIELIAPTDPALLSSPPAVGDPANFLQLFVAGEGLAGYALLSRNLQADVVAMRNRGLTVSDPAPNSRLRPDGERIAWRGAFIEGTLTPFFIEDETPRVLRVSDKPGNVRQPNGVIGVANMVVVVSNLEQGVARYRAILSSDPQPGSPVRDAKTADFALSDITLTLAEPHPGSNPLRAHLTKRGESLYTVRLSTTDATHIGLLDMVRAHGARIELVSKFLV